MAPRCLDGRQGLHGNRRPLLCGGLFARIRSCFGFARNALLESDAASPEGGEGRAGTRGAGGHGDRLATAGAARLRGTERLRRAEEHEPATESAGEFWMA